MTMKDDAARRFRVVEPEPSEPAARPVDPSAADIAVRIRFALDELERVDVSAAAGRQAGELLADIAHLTEADAESFEGRKRELWAAVANARTAVRREQATLEVGPVVPPRLVERIHELDDSVGAAQAKANRKLASPNAYRKLIEAKKDLAAALAEAGFETVEDLDLAASVERQVEAPEAQVRRIREELVAAEAAWAEFEAQDPGALPAGTEGDALRARAYRVLGEVVDDAELHQRLTDLEARGRRGADALAVLEGALRDAGFDPGEDAVALGQLYLRAQ
jgi:hypothetical protein